MSAKTLKKKSNATKPKKKKAPRKKKPKPWPDKEKWEKIRKRLLARNIRELRKAAKKIEEEQGEMVYRFLSEEEMKAKEMASKRRKK